MHQPYTYSSILNYRTNKKNCINNKKKSFLKLKNKIIFFKFVKLYSMSFFFFVPNFLYRNVYVFVRVPIYYYPVRGNKKQKISTILKKNVKHKKWPLNFRKKVKDSRKPCNVIYFSEDSFLITNTFIILFVSYYPTLRNKHFKKFFTYVSE